MQIHEITLNENSEASDHWEKRLRQAQSQGYDLGPMGTSAALWLAKKLRPKSRSDVAVKKNPEPLATVPDDDRGIIVNPGQRLSVPVKTAGAQAPTYYYKTTQGWTNEVGEKITNPSSIANLEARADAGMGRIENIPRVSKVNKKSDQR